MRELEDQNLIPTLRKYESDAAIFISKYTNGLYLHKEYSQDKVVPSLRILSTPSIDFSNTTAWAEKYWLFLEYMGMSKFCDTYQASIIAVQNERIFKKSNVSKGVTVLYSEKDVPTDMPFTDKHRRILGNASVLNVALLDYFLPLYWANHNIFSTLESWKRTIKDKIPEIKSKSLTTKQLEENVTEIINLYGQFVAFSNNEKVNIRTARKNFNIKKYLKGPPSFTAYLYDLELFKRISDMIDSSLNGEETFIDDIQKDVDALTSYYRDMSNLKLSSSNLLLQKSNILVQKRIGLFTIVVAIVGVAVGVASFFLLAR